MTSAARGPFNGRLTLTGGSGAAGGSAGRAASIDGTPATDRPNRLEWAVAVAAATVCAAVVMITSDDLWFYADAWPMLAEGSLTSFDEWLRPHGGHWLIPARMGSKALFEVVGMNFYPWFFLPRVALYAVLAIGWWRVCRWRGVAPQLALGMLVLFSWLGLSGWIVTLVYIGPVVVNLCALVAAYLVQRSDLDRNGQLVLTGVLLVAAMSSASGPALLGAVFLVAMTSSDRGRYLWPIGTGLTVYGAWYLLVARNDPSPLTPTPPSIGEVLRAPIGMADLIGSGLAGTFGLGDDWAIPFAIALTIGIGAAFRAGWLNRFDAVMLLTGLAIAALGVLVRGGQGIEVNAPNRLYLVSVYLLFGLAPAALAHIPARGRAPATVAMTALAVLNLSLLIDEIDLREQARSHDRPLVEAAAFAIADGESYIPWLGPSPQAHHKNLQALVDKGWVGRDHPDKADQVLARMKMTLFRSDQAGGAPLLAPADVIDTDGCVTVGGGGQDHRFEVTGHGIALLDLPDGAELSMRWVEADRSILWSGRPGPVDNALVYANPGEGSAVMTLTVRGAADGSICGVAPSGD